MVDEPIPSESAEAAPAERLRLAGYGAYSNYSDDLEDNTRFHHHLRVLYRRRWSAMCVFLLALTWTIVHNFTAVRMYEAQVRVLVEAETVNLVNFEDVIDQRRSLDAELAILRSRWLADRTVKALGQAQHNAGGEATTERKPDNELTAGWWSDASAFASRIVGVATTPPREPFPGEKPSDAQQISAFLNGLSLSLSATGTGVLDIKYRSSDPEAAARFANAHAEEYINQQRETRFAALQEVTGWLAARIAEQKKKVDASEEALLRFREQNQLVVAEASPLIITSLNELTAALTEAQTARFEKESVYQKALALRGTPDELDRLPQMMNTPALRQLRLELDRLQRQRTQLARTFRDLHPEMVKIAEAIQAAQSQLDFERSRVLEAMREDLAIARAAEANQTRALDGLKAQATAQNRKSVELSILTRELESHRQIYDMFTQRARETGVVREINPIRTRILDPALVPSSPVSPNTRSNLFRGIFAGVALAFVVAFGFEYADNRIKSPRDIGRRLGLPFIGLVPQVKVKDGSRGPLTTDARVSTEFIEELRRIRTNVLFSLAEDRSRSIAITSAGPAEGKTTISSNLAILLAQAGQRVLLIDADMRLPGVHASFSIEQEPGLSNVLVGNTKASDALRQSEVANLWILPAGHLPPNPSELLGSERFRKFLAALRDQFDWVVIDTPPVMAVTDACVIGHLAGGMLFVAGAEMVSVNAARRALEQLTMADAKLIGGILSRVHVMRHGYYYSTHYQGYNRKYSRYYQRPPAS